MNLFDAGLDRDAERELVARARACAAAIAPRALDFERHEAVPDDVYRDLATGGLMAVTTPTDLGGSGASTLAYANAIRHIARACPSVAVTMAVTNMVGEVLLAFGTDAQRSRYIPGLAAGGHGAFALSESGAGSDPAGMTTRAKRTSGGYRLSGAKQWISHADTAEVMVVWALLEDEGITCFLVDRATEGVEIVGHEDKLGLRASHTCQVAFDDAFVPEDALLGAVGKGFRVAMVALDGGRIGIGAQALGTADAALVAAAQDAGAGALDRASLGTREATRRAAWALVVRAARKKTAGEAFSLDAASAKALATESAWETIAWLHGYALSLSDAAPAVDKALRDVRVSRIYEGTSEIQRVVIARALCGR